MLKREKLENNSMLANQPSKPDQNVDTIIKMKKVIEEYKGKEQAWVAKVERNEADNKELRAELDLRCEERQMIEKRFIERERELLGKVEALEKSQRR